MRNEVGEVEGSRVPAKMALPGGRLDGWLGGRFRTWLGGGAKIGS